jgi:hypothetical protein
MTLTQFFLIRGLPALSGGFLLIIANVAAATTYYVATTGNDGNSGFTSTSALRSIQTAINKAVAGDTIFIVPGTYVLTASLSIWKKCGTSANWITITSGSSQSTILDASALPAGSNGVSIGGAGSTPACFIQLKHVAIRNSSLNGVAIIDAHDISLFDVEVSGSYKNGVSTSGPGYNITLYSLYIHDNVLEHQNLQSAQWDQAVRFTDISNSLVENSTIINNWGEGVDVYSRTMDGNNNAVKYNYFKNNFGTDIYVDHALNTVINGNFVTSDNPAYNRYGAPAMGIAVADEAGDAAGNATGTIVTNNIVVGAIEGFRYGAWGLGVGLKNTSVWNNTFVDCALDGIGIDQPSSGTNTGNTFVNNIFYLTVHYSYATRIFSGMAGLVFHNNLWFGATSGRIGSGSDITGNPVFVGACQSNVPVNCFQLQSTSPAIGKGTANNSLVSTDFAGDQRSGAVTIGAFQ